MSDRQPFATVDDVALLWRPLTADEITRTTALLPVLSDDLRVIASSVGKDMDVMVAESGAYANVAKSVTVDAVSRILRQDTEGEAMTQYSQSALGYSVSGTYAIPGGGITNAFLEKDLKRLGLRNQSIGVIYTWQESKASQ